MSECIVAGSRVSLHFALYLDTGETVESTFAGEPATLVVGDGSLPEGFEGVLPGLQAGAHVRVTLAPEQAFGLHRAENVQVFPRVHFGRDLALEPGLVINFADKAGASVPGVVQAVAADTVTVDFNHPLAGRALDFEVQILAVEPPEPT